MIRFAALLMFILIVTTGCVSNAAPPVETQTPIPDPTTIPTTTALIVTTTATPEPTITERFSHGGFGTTGEERCKELGNERGYSYRRWGADYDGREYCVFSTSRDQCDGYGCWRTKIYLDKK